MSESKQSVLVYLVLLGFVGLMIFIVLQAGKGLQAPASIGGKWQLTTQNDCTALGLSNGEYSLEIQQSGSILQANLSTENGEVNFHGRLDGVVFEITSIGIDGITLQGTLNRETQPNTIAATIDAQACQSPVNISGIRQANNSAEVGAH